ncbi:P-loop containing nucleoside triphosphate hydrolase [Pseudocohnilembus persalinus]|uniref:p-loop containing nucleoside triphosphate hydrolase n=1 Tax=Pseudocohnilembus persalinus TaxID=266149 RepID=A0A0V0R056_PSEPJ|nr:P-loop containing nucleoside triphosphate hydrolase [Pseudocohnilembus persalinus]|eukprot:KRX07900.1 P-loop containing nucleoside triphosphate hydrolase [Pseudocohnilembus persalinus]
MDTSRCDNGQIKVTILGKSAVGKSSLCLRFIMNSFSDKYDPSIQETHRKNFVLDQKAVQLANKTDLENRQISKEQGEEFAKQIGAVYLETSAKFDINCEKAFTSIVREIWVKKGINLVQEDNQNLKKRKKKKKKILGVCNLI